MSDPSPDRAVSGGARRAALVFNPVKADPALRGIVETQSAVAGWDEPLVYETTVDDLGDDVTREALAAGAQAVLVAGGDGTVRAVAAAVSGTGIPLTIVPSGTGNLLARNLHLPLADPTTMVRATFTGRTLAADIGFATIVHEDGTSVEEAFVVMGGMGLDAAMIANTNPQLKKAVGWVAYVDGAARALIGAKPFKVDLRMEGRRLHHATVQSVLVANCGDLPAGITLVPGASIADGLLDVAAIQPAGPFGWLKVWQKIAFPRSARRLEKGRLVRRRRDRAAIDYRRGPGVEITTYPPRPVQLDGDEFGEAVELHCRVDAGALLLALPDAEAVAQAATPVEEDPDT